MASSEGYIESKDILNYIRLVCYIFQSLFQNNLYYYFIPHFNLLFLIENTDGYYYYNYNFIINLIIFNNFFCNIHY